MNKVRIIGGEKKMNEEIKQYEHCVKELVKGSDKERGNARKD